MRKSDALKSPVIWSNRENKHFQSLDKQFHGKDTCGKINEGNTWGHNDEHRLNITLIWSGIFLSFSMFHWLTRQQSPKTEHVFEDMLQLRSVLFKSSRTEPNLDKIKSNRTDKSRLDSGSGRQIQPISPLSDRSSVGSPTQVNIILCVLGISEIVFYNNDLSNVRDFIRAQFPWTIS